MAKKIILGLALIFLLAGCTAGAEQSLPDTGLDATQAVSPETVQAAQQYLAAQLGVDVSQLELISAIHTEWPGGCLGLPDEGEACTQAIVPGWRIDFSVNGEMYEVRTDETGATIRVAP